MALKTFLIRIGAAGALAFATLTPIAMADQRGDRDRGHYDRGGHHSNNYRGDRNRGYHRGDRRDHRYNRRGHRGDYRRGRHYRHNNRGYYDRGHYNRGRVVTRNYYSSPSYYRPRPRVVYHYDTGYRHPRYRVGNRFAYGANTVIIRDYDRYGLYNPPRGHQWVHHRGSNDAVLTSVATGAIVGLAIGILTQ